GAVAEEAIDLVVGAAGVVLQHEAVPYRRVLTRSRALTGVNGDAGALHDVAGRRTHAELTILDQVLVLRAEQVVRRRAELVPAELRAQRVADLVGRNRRTAARADLHDARLRARAVERRTRCALHDLDALDVERVEIDHARAQD